MSTTALQRVPIPDLSRDLPRVSITIDDYRRRCDIAYARAQVDWLVVYGDREHAGNLHYLCGFDPRFEEALLVVGPNGGVTLLAGNEGVSYAGDLPDFVDIELAQTFSLMGQDRSTSPRLGDCLKAVGITSGHTVGLVGWKYLELEEVSYGSGAHFVPAHIVAVLEQCTGSSPIDKTRVLLSPVDGLRSLATAAQIAEHARVASVVSRAVFDVVRHARPGVKESALARRSASHAADPFSIHPILATGSGRINGLRSASDRVLERGDAAVHAVGHRFALTCRAGVVAEGPTTADHDQYLQGLVFPYFGAISTWLSTVEVGVRGGELWEVIHEKLRLESFKPALNPGHLIGYEEWTHTPIRQDSTDEIQSGMVLQLDIIPSPVPDGWATNCEDTVAVANADLRAELSRDFPEVWDRICQNRRFITSSLGIELSEDLLPLSPTTAVLPPFWQNLDLICCVN